MKRITILAAAGALAVTPLVGALTAQAASADGAQTATRSAAQHRIADRRGEPEPGDDHGQDGRHHHRHGGDDGPRHH